MLRSSLFNSIGAECKKLSLSFPRPALTLVATLPALWSTMCLIPARDPNPHVSLGAGIHFCMIAPLARLEMLIAFEVLFARLPKLRLVGTPHYKDDYHFHGLEELRVGFD